MRAVRETGAAMLLTDDAAARLAARTLGISAHGTIGLIVRMQRTGTRNREGVLRLLRMVPSQSTLFIQRALLDEVILEVSQTV
jgi:predicted nucleic acid-binding protein